VKLKPRSGEGVERLAYSPAEVAAAFGLSRKAIYRAIASGELRAARVCHGSRLVIPADEAQAWVQRNLPQRASEPAVRGLGVNGGRSARPLRAALAELEASTRNAT
jgi:excisionase family DNA binding protein